MKTNTLIYGLLAAVLLLFNSCTKDEIDKILTSGTGPLSQAEIAEGLKEALRVGTDTSVSILSVTNGYFGDEVVKILLPKEAQIITDNLNNIGGFPAADLLKNELNTLIGELVLKINRAAEDAAIEAKPILKNAITSMTITDAVDILYGEDTAATSYLRRTSYDPLFDVFKPKVQNSLAKEIVGGVSAENAYATVIDKYNELVNTANTFSIITGETFPLVSENSLSNHTTNGALKGLFVKVADEEKNIRLDPLARVTSILEKVFGELDKNK